MLDLCVLHEYDERPVPRRAVWLELFSDVSICVQHAALLAGPVYLTLLSICK